jgi:hypothetical protein
LATIESLKADAVPNGTNDNEDLANVGRTLREKSEPRRLAGDVQMLAGHAALSATQRYTEADVEAQKKVVELI